MSVRMKDRGVVQTCDARDIAPNRAHTQLIYIYIYIYIYICVCVCVCVRVCVFMMNLSTTIGLTPSGSSTVQYTFTHKQYTEQHNETKYPERNIHNSKNT